MTAPQEWAGYHVDVGGVSLPARGTGGGMSCAGRSLLDFFTVTTDLRGIPDIIYTGGDLANGVQLYFTKRWM